MEHICNHSHASYRLGAYKQAVLIGSLALALQVLLVVMSGSLALLSDTVHLASDNIFLIGSLLVIWRASSVTHEKGAQWRTKAAYVGILLLVVGAYGVNSEADVRTINPVSVANGWVLAGGIIGLIANLFMLRVLHAEEKDTQTFVRHEGFSKNVVLLQRVPSQKNPSRHAHDNVVSAHVFFDFAFSAVVTLSAILSLVFGMESIDTVIAKYLSFFMFLLAGYLLCQTNNGGHEH